MDSELSEALERIRDFHSDCGRKPPRQKYSAIWRLTAFHKPAEPGRRACPVLKTDRLEAYYSDWLMPQSNSYTLVSYALAVKKASPSPFTS